MSHDKLYYMKECLIHYVEQEMCNLPEVNAEELGEAIDMIKDLEEAIYYCTITEAMNSDKQKDYEFEMQRHGESERMYYEGDWDRKTEHEKTPWHHEPRSWEHENAYPKEKDWREGRSPESRRMYMEGRDNGNDKANQLRELEKYMQELSQDIVEMIQEASPDEKQYLEKKLVALSSKIGQMK